MCRGVESASVKAMAITLTNADILSIVPLRKYSSGIFFNTTSCTQENAFEIVVDQMVVSLYRAR